VIDGFENITKELTEYENDNVLPRVIQGLNKRFGEKNIITNSTMVKVLKSEGFKISGPRIRKIIHEIRVNHIIPRLVSSSNGYYIATSHKELDIYIKSLQQRRASITETIKAMQKDYGQWLTGSQQSIFNSYGQ